MLSFDLVILVRCEIIDETHFVLNFESCKPILPVSPSKNMKLVEILNQVLVRLTMNKLHSLHSTRMIRVDLSEGKRNGSNRTCCHRKSELLSTEIIEKDFFGHSFTS